MKISTAFTLLFSFLLFFPSLAHASGVAEVKSTQEGPSVYGVVIFEEKEGGLQVVADISNAPPGKHGFHIHEKGSCEDQGNAAGGHFNPDGAPHGLVMKDGASMAHAGDLGNIEIDQDGTGMLDEFIPNLTLKEGKYAVGGLAVILHEKEDDFGQPTGNAGGRIGCGVIQVE